MVSPYPYCSKQSPIYSGSPQSPPSKSHSTRTPTPNSGAMSIGKTIFINCQSIKTRIASLVLSTWLYHTSCSI